LTAAFACGLFDGEYGRDLRARLTGDDDNGFRSAIAECQACWFLSAVLKLPVRPRPEGRPGKLLDLLVEHPEGNLNVEVKAPYRERPSGPRAVWYGDDSDALVRCLEEANKQFAPKVRNVLLLVPELKVQLYNGRNQLVRALYGDTKITFFVDTQTGSAVSEPKPEFYPDGSLLKSWGDGPKPQRFTRVGAVVSLEEKPKEQHDGLFLLEPKALVAHNPFAIRRIPTSIWRPYPQLLESGDRMEWTDREGGGS
jgi:hypothetical protein